MDLAKGDRWSVAALVVVIAIAFVTTALAGYGPPAVAITGDVARPPVAAAMRALSQT